MGSKHPATIVFQSSSWFNYYAHTHIHTLTHQLSYLNLAVHRTIGDFTSELKSCYWDRGYYLTQEA